MNLKPISKAAIPRALELAERYRLLNEPEQAASICHDVLICEPGNEEAVRTLFLATTELFSHRHGTTLEDADVVVKHFVGDYERAYYSGVARERWARAKLQQKEHLSLIADWLRRAMDQYELAETLRPENNDDALLRWNACARLIGKIPGLAEESEERLLLGD